MHRDDQGPRVFWKAGRGGGCLRSKGCAPKLPPQKIFAFTIFFSPEECFVGPGSGGGAGMHWKGGRYAPPPPPSRAPSLCPATVPLTPSASLNGICNRQ